MRVLIVTNEYPPHIFGGIGTFCYNLSNALAASGVSVTVVTGCPPRELKKGYKEPILQNRNLEVIRLPRTTDLPPSHLWYQMMNLDFLRNLVPNYDVVHGQDCSTFPLISVCKMKSIHPPWVVTIHTSPFSELKSVLESTRAGQPSLRELISYVAGYPLWDSSIRGHFRFADSLVTVSKSLMKEIETSYSIGGKPLSVIHTGVDINNLQKIARHSEAVPLPDSGSEKLRLFFGGRFYWRKGILHLLESIRYLMHELHFIDFRLEIFGRGPLDNRIRREISNLNIGSNIDLRGFVTYDRLMSSLANSHIVCFPSLYEACPLGMIEAMALGKPIAAFDRPFSRELLGVREQSMLPNSTKEYAKLLHQLCNDGELRKSFGERLSCRARMEFDIEKVATNYSKLYDDALS
jgi:glycosyltransferase involved in cell wall biosynthesis